MSNDRQLVVETGMFAEVLEAKIEAGNGMFEETHPFLRTVMRGLAERLGDEKVAPHGIVLTTELFINDVNAGVDGFTGEPMPLDATGFPPKMAETMIRMSAGILVRETFGDEFADAVQDVYKSL